MSKLEYIKDIKKWVIENDLEKETIKGFWGYFNSWKEEHPDEYEETFQEGFEPEKLNIYVDSVSLTIMNWPEESMNNIIIKLDLDYDDGEVTMGYRMFFDYETGEIEDDVLSFY